MKTRPRLLTLKVSEEEYVRLCRRAERLTDGNLSKLLRDAALGELKKYVSPATEAGGVGAGSGTLGDKGEKES